MDPRDLERLADTRLRRLPQPRAPRTLLPRVMIAVRGAPRPWYQRDWFSWPAAWQMLSAICLVSLVVGLSLWVPLIQMSVDAQLAGAVGPIAAPVIDTITDMQVLGRAARVLLRAMQPAGGVLLVFVLVMCAVCAGFGAVLRRVALGGALRS